uniref:Z-binding domain-containing protein n=1 Tax=Chromera velia CCMP2878 TaxID=1169474 RepID=A0A0G4HKD3_9ALVE|eukprot:Cvel_28426.t1-p1 / transcript=Cvel_28426.t1 / gene=Cvel_28426 / organism=Chromera_velia_CCMP2878 / gene_product=hypothetical protein / transcript_product=hypothetical protein / location=Cvel_scaffold3719:4821-6744(+) / protein_length=603 / sequence_SO=supercontig / SO=protein_coding / is_pseudo=false
MAEEPKDLKLCGIPPGWDAATIQGFLSSALCVLADRGENLEAKELERLSSSGGETAEWILRISNADLISSLEKLNKKSGLAARKVFIREKWQQVAKRSQISEEEVLTSSKVFKVVIMPSATPEPDPLPPPPQPLPPLTADPNPFSRLAAHLLTAPDPNPSAGPAAAAAAPAADTNSEEEPISPPAALPQGDDAVPNSKPTTDTEPACAPDEKEQQQKENLIIRENVLDFMRKNSAKPLSTQSIATGTLGKKASKKDINPVLYSLMHQDLIRKVQDKNPPLWVLTAPPGKCSSPQRDRESHSAPAKTSKLTNAKSKTCHSDIAVNPPEGAFIPETRKEGESGKAARRRSTRQRTDGGEAQPRRASESQPDHAAPKPPAQSEIPVSSAEALTKPGVSKKTHASFPEIANKQSQPLPAETAKGKGTQAKPKGRPSKRPPPPPPQAPMQRGNLPTLPASVPTIMAAAKSKPCFRPPSHRLAMPPLSVQGGGRQSEESAEKGKQGDPNSNPETGGEKQKNGKPKSPAGGTGQPPATAASPSDHPPSPSPSPLAAEAPDQHCDSATCGEVGQRACDSPRVGMQKPEGQEKDRGVGKEKETSRRRERKEM